MNPSLSAMARLCTAPPCWSLDGDGVDGLARILDDHEVVQGQLAGARIEYKQRFGYNQRRALMILPVRQTHAENARRSGLADRIRRHPRPMSSCSGWGGGTSTPSRRSSRGGNAAHRARPPAPPGTIAVGFARVSGPPEGQGATPDGGWP
jgi:hypothetical protein